MTFRQMQERLRHELLRRIERRTLSVSLLARQTGLGQAHVSNFLHGRRALSLTALDAILKAQQLEFEDLLPARREVVGGMLSGQVGEAVQLPLVSATTAMFEPYLRPSNVQSMLPFPAEALSGLLVRCSTARKQWERFVVVRMGAEEVRAMAPMLMAEALVVVDRHYNSFRAYREGVANVFAVRVGGRMVVRYADMQLGRVVLRPEGREFAVEVVEPGPGETANDLLVGRVALVLNG